MKAKAEVGDLILSVAGRDKGRLFLAVRRENEYVYITDGKTRKTTNPKRKKDKHLKVIKTAVDVSLAEEIAQGRAVSSRKVKQLIGRQSKNKTGGESLCQKTT